MMMMMMTTSMTNLSQVSDPLLSTLDTLLYSFPQEFCVAYTSIILILHRRKLWPRKVKWLAHGPWLAVKSQPWTRSPLLYRWDWALSCLGQGLQPPWASFQLCFPPFEGPLPKPQVGCQTLSKGLQMGGNSEASTLPLPTARLGLARASRGGLVRKGRFISNRPHPDPSGL